MTPQPQRKKLVIRTDSKGNNHIAHLIIADVPEADMVRMRKYGQLDCGKRQRFINVQLAELPEKVQTELFRLRCVTASTASLSFEGPESKGEANKCVEAICRVAAQLFEFTQPNPMIPCV